MMGLCDVSCVWLPAFYFIVLYSILSYVCICCILFILLHFIIHVTFYLYSFYGGFVLFKLLCDVYLFILTRQLLLTDVPI